MSAWTEASVRAGERATAAAGMPAGSAPAFVMATFAPSEQARKMLSGLVSDDDVDEAVTSCRQVARNTMSMLDLCSSGEGQHATLMVLVAHMYAQGIAYGQAR